MVTKQGETSGMLRVVIVDDTSAIRARVRGLAEDVAGVEVVGEAGGVREAWSVIEGTHPDVVILDMRLPDGTGLDVLRALERPRRAPRVIVLSNEACPVVWRECLAAGAEWCFDKSTEFGRVPEVLATLVADARARADGSEPTGQAATRRARVFAAQRVERLDGVNR